MNYPGPAMSNTTYGNTGGGKPASDQLVIQQYLFTVRKYLRPIALFTAIVTCLAAWYAYTATPVYRATATMLLENQEANLVSIEELYGDDSESADYDDTQFQLLRSRTLANRVIERLALWRNPELTGTATGESAAVGGESATGAGPLGGIIDGISPSAITEWIGSAEGPDGAGTAQEDTAPRLTTPYTTGRADGARLKQALHEEQVISAFLARLKISPVRNTKLVNISYASADPALATLVANTVGEEFIQNFLDAKFALTTSASAWLTERLGDLKDDLDEAQKRLITFQRDNDLVDIQGSVGRLNEQQLLLDTAELAQARSRLSEARDLYDDVRAVRGDPEALATVPAIQADSLVQRTNTELGGVQRQLDELLNRYGERHPLVLDRKSELASLAVALERHVDRAADTIAKDYQLAQQRVTAINAKLSSGRSEIQLIGDKKFELDALQQEVETKRSVYAQYFDRMTEAASKDGLETANARISDRARIPIEPFKPKREMIVAAGFLGSLLISVLIAFLREALDDSVKGTNDVEAKLGLGLLGVLPVVKSGLMKRNTSLPLSPGKIQDKNGTFAEAVNTIRTALTLNDQNSPRKVIVITSSVRGEGKSTSAMNIAYSLGQLERVLLVDCDMRRPSIARAVGLRKNSKGLSDLIANTATAQECINRGMMGGHVDILPCGPIPNQPLELLSSKRFARILQEVGRYYDRIVIDTAPTQAVSDALILSRLADSVVYVVKSHKTPMNLVRRGITRLQRVGAPIEGVLVTQVNVRKISAYAGNYSQQGYHDSQVAYGYADTDRVQHPRVKLSAQEIMAIRNDEGAVNLGIDSMYNGTAVPSSAPPRPKARRKPVAAELVRNQRAARRVEHH